MTAPAPVEAVAESTTPATATPLAPPTPSPANMPATQTSAAAAPTTESGEGEGETESAAESARLAKLGRENAKYRTERNELQAALEAQKAEREQERAEAAQLKETMAKVAAIFNPDANQPPDPAKLVEQIAARDAEIAKVTAEWHQERNTLKVEAALPGVLADAKADPSLTTAVLTASGALAKLDPSSDTFKADLASAVAAAIEANPRLKVDAPAAPTRRSGVEIPGRSGGSNQLTREDVDALAKTPGALDKARREGRFKNLGVG